MSNANLNFVIDGQRKHKLDDVLETDPPKSPSIKHKELDDDSHSLVTPPQSPCTQLIRSVNNLIYILRITAFFCVTVSSYQVVYD